MVPIRLTAVAAQPDMGVIVWLLGPARAVPLNYLHVLPNYTKLNWYFGTFAAYASYQALITDAMNEAGGQGFATDYAGRDLDVLAQLPTVETVTNEIVSISQASDDASFIAQVARSFILPQKKVLEILHRDLPLAVGDQDYIYSVEELLVAKFSAEKLAVARPAVLADLDKEVVQPLAETLAVFDGGLYLTRLYTTLSSEEMTLDPVFSFNSDMGDQALDRNARLVMDCNQWSLTLGSGTGREGELVISGSGDPFFGPAPAIAQDSVFLSERLTVTGQGEVVARKTFPVAEVTSQSVTAPRQCGLGSGSCGAGTGLGMILTILGLRGIRTTIPRPSSMSRDASRRDPNPNSRNCIR